MQDAIRRITQLIWSSLLLGGFVCQVAAADTEAVQLFIKDGQLKSRPIQVFIAKDLTESMNPSLMLAREAVQATNGLSLEPLAPTVVARNQKSIQIVNGQEISVTGTLILFDLRNRLDLPFFKAVIRLTPILTWKETDAAGNETVHRAIHPNQVYIGNIVGALGWTCFTVLLLIGAFAFMCKKSKGYVFILFVGADGRFSLWRTQLIAWTIAIGSVVFAFGISRLKLPEIPETLLALMGLSLATGGASYLGGRNRQKKEIPLDEATIQKLKERGFFKNLADLICEFPDPNGRGIISIAMAQMAFWTGLMLCIFWIKSIQESGLWAIPWEMVALMGMSQAGYVGPKFVLPNESSEQPAPKKSPKKRKRTIQPKA